MIGLILIGITFVITGTFIILGAILFNYLR